MKIALISPKADFLSRNPEFNKFWLSSKYLDTYRRGWSGIGLGLLVIASLTPSSVEIDLIDENFNQIDFSNNYDLVGITAMTQQALRAYQIADKFRKRNIKVVIGGIHATILPKEAKQYADSVVIGEAEYVWSKLLKDFKKDKLKPFYRSKEIVNLKDSPIPRYDLLKPKNYQVIWIQTSRGCPHDCEFCAASKIYSNTYRTKTIEQVIDEIKYIKNIFKDIQINFGDDNLFVKKNYSKSFLKEIISLRIRWFAQSDISIAKDSNILNLMRISGCNCLFLGLESLSEAGLRKIDKHGWKLNYLKNYSDYIKIIQSFGIGVMGAFIIGLDSDDSYVFRKISDFIIENDLYEAQITISTPFPGTRLRDRLIKEKRLLPTDWDNYTGFDVNFIHPRLTKKDLEDGLLQIYKDVHNKEVYLKKMAYFKEIQRELIKENM